MEIEDDLFFQDLSKQISLLIMDDDEDPVARCPSVSLQRAKAQEFSFQDHPSQEGRTGKGDSTHPTPNLKGNLITQEGFLIYPTKILLTPKNAKQQHIG
ncbi:hypothetical protein PVL29_005864 [Vitis rotundifolia]|uniref:Uncharacterized protein n=1 Tax=Vitis rotundifolia TaxID=103349 RepID=A0AA39A4C8_VITRO|nr:hypothetical protein PVL29_005864 [Vitis rotundifolia]